MSTSDDAGYSSKLRSSTRLSQEAQETGRERSRSRPDSRWGSRDSRRGRPPDEGSGDDAKNNTTGHRQSTPTDRVDSPVRKEEAEQPPPWSGSPRRQLSLAPGERSQLASPRSTEHHRRHLDSRRSTEHNRQSFRGRSIHADTHSALAFEVARAKRALNDAKLTVLRREARRCRHDEDGVQAKAVVREAALVLERARRALALSAASTAAGATAPPSPPAHPLGVPRGHHPGTTPS